MCLIIKNGTKRRTAKKDMTVYKVIANRESPVNGRGEYRTPYMAMHVEIGKTYRSRLVRGSAVFNFYNGGGLHSVINAGLHSYDNLEDAKLAALSHVVVRCTIPAGSKYYVGHENEIASDTLRYDEIVNI